VPTSFLCGIHLRANVPKGEVARRLGGCLGVMRTHGLEPFTFVAEAWRDGSTRVFGGTSLVHPQFAARTGDPFWGAGFMLVHAPAADATVITMTTPATPADGDADAWRWLLGLAEDLCDAIGADLGLINGFSLKRGRAVGSTPAGREVAPGHPPLVLCPWMYLGAMRLDEDGMTDGLSALANVAARSVPTRGGGWVLQPHDEYSDAPPSALQDAYATTFHLPHLPEWLGVP
jgi:hypothetical protein